MRRLLRTFRKFLFPLLGHRYLLLTRLLYRANPLMEGSGITDLSRTIYSRLANVRGGYYVELGAADGIRRSNTLLLEIFLDWTGTLIEPVPALFSALMKNRSRSRNYLSSSAVVGDSFVLPTVQIALAGLMSTPLNVESDIGDPIAHARRGMKIKNLGDELSVISVPAVTLTRLLDKASAPHQIDLLSLDVEGGELEVLKGIDFEKYSFALMVIECRDIARLAGFLEDKGYELIEQLDKDCFFAPADRQSNGLNRPKPAPESV